MDNGLCYIINKNINLQCFYKTYLPKLKIIHNCLILMNNKHNTNVFWLKQFYGAAFSVAYNNDLWRAFGSVLVWTLTNVLCTLFKHYITNMNMLWTLCNRSLYISCTLRIYDDKTITPKVIVYRSLYFLLTRLCGGWYNLALSLSRPWRCDKMLHRAIVRQNAAQCDKTDDIARVKLCRAVPWPRGLNFLSEHNFEAHWPNDHMYQVLLK